MLPPGRFGAAAGLQLGGAAAGLQLGGAGWQPGCSWLPRSGIG